MLKKYPVNLPAALKGDRAFQLVDPLVSSASENGQTRWDRRFTATPASTPVSWIFTNLECQAFQAWYRDQLRDGAEWFEMPLRSPMGRLTEQCHFLQAYSGPEPVGFDRWRISANMVLRRMPLPPLYEGDFPDDILYSELFDRTLNIEWPGFTFDFLTYAAAVAAIRTLRNGIRVTIEKDETRGGNRSCYEVARADSPSLNLDFMADQYLTGESQESLTLVVTYAS